MVNLRCKLCALILSANLGLHLAAIFIELGKKGKRGNSGKGRSKEERKAGKKHGSLWGESYCHAGIKEEG